MKIAYSKLSFLWITLPALAAFVIFSGCGSDNPIDKFSPEIVNNPNSFSFQITDAVNLTWTKDYSWSNSGTMASVDHSPSGGATGTATLVLLDSNGTEVYSRDLKVDGVFDSSLGVAGNWTVRITFDNFNGTMNFRAEKK
jgi:hypothetical protein